MDFLPAGDFGVTQQSSDLPARAGRWLAQSAPAAAAAESEQASDRRTDDRAKTSIYRSALLHAPEVETFCLIRNISSGGLMCELAIELAPDTPIAIEMRSGQSIKARVVWCRERRIGVEFAERVDVPALLASLREVCDGWKPRMPRLATASTATLEIDNESGTVDLLDLSQGGAKIDGVRLSVGEAVTLTIPGMDPRRGVVRWAKDGQAGIGFMRAIPFDVLARWTIDQRPASGSHTA